MSVDPSSIPDPWIAPPAEQGGQAGRLKAFCRVIIAGTDVTSRLNPYLLSVEVHDGFSPGALSCQIELDDRNGVLPIPPINSPVSVVLGWVGGQARMWNFFTQHIISSFQRAGGAGRHLTIQCTGANLLSLNKTPVNDHLGEGAPPGSEVGSGMALGQWLQQIAAWAGGVAYVHPELANITRDYWHAASESPLHHFERMAQEHGALARVENGAQFIFTQPGQNWDGSTPPTVNATWHVNLLAWRIFPFVARSTWMAARQSWFDPILGNWNSGIKNFDWSMPFSSSSATFQPPRPGANSQNATQENLGAEQTSAYPGDGLITINGEPAAAANGFVHLTGARPGVDGIWHIISSEHTYSRAGYITYLTVQPWLLDAVDAAYTNAAVWQPTAAEYQAMTYGIDFPPNPAPANIQPAPVWPQPTVTIGQPTVSSE